jgi:hypothetical protein
VTLDAKKRRKLAVRVGHLTMWNRVLLWKLIVAQLVNKFPTPYKKVLVPYSQDLPLDQELVESLEFNPKPHTLFLEDLF